MPSTPLPTTQQALLDQGLALHTAGRVAEARDLYRRIDPANADSARLLGAAEYQLGNLEDSLVWLQKSVALIPEQAEVHRTMGDILLALGRLEAAVACYDRTLLYDRRYAHAWTCRGDALLRLGRMEAAADSYTKALLVNPDLPWVPGMLLYTRLVLADWRDFDARKARLLDDMARSDDAQMGMAAPPSALQWISDSPALQRRAAESYMARKYPAGAALPAPVRRPRPERLRIGYVSSDFRNHPLTHLLAGLFERHDRDRFEIFVFSFLDQPADAWTRRVQAGVDHWVDLTGASARDAAQAIRDRQIDIAVDLSGLTEGCRADVFAERPAPVQASYLGYLGTMGADYYDYLIADEVIVPPDRSGFYTEKIACLPSFQINDDSQQPSGRSFTRAELSLPESGFVFATFNRVYKILPDVFAGWMRILRRVPGSVLWLHCGSLTARNNLKAEAGRHGIDPARIVFAELMQPEDHLARLSQADLILDTFPYNSGATASGALRMGVPMLTRIGESFPARMGASLMTAVGLPEMITETPEAYEALAVALATDPARLAAIRAKLATNLPGSILFDTTRAVRGLEAVFETMHANPKTS